MFKKSTSKCNIPNNTCKTPASMLRSSISPWSSVDFSLKLSNATCVQSLGKSASVVLRCSRMQGTSSLHTVLVGSMAPYLRFSMMRKFVLRSILCEFDMSPMEKKQEKLRL